MLYCNVKQIKRMNRRIFALIFACISIQTINAQTGYPVDPVPFTAVKVKPESFWGQRLQAAREVTIPLAFSKGESEGRYRNFVQCQHPSDDYAHTKFPFDDTDVYKTIEGASYILMTMDKGEEKQRLTDYIDSVLVLVGKAQEEDGYLFTPRTMSPGHPHSWVGKTRWEVEEINSHELYNLGHMVDAACAHYQATGSRQFLDIAVRYADCVVKEIGPDATQVQKISVQENGTIASDPYTLKLIPYYAWNHRGANAMTVWFPYTLSRLRE